ncbi:hypothetical protein [Kitasatospora herbaricolor]
MDLLRWWRFLWALDLAWDRATRADARDFTRWMQLTDKPVRVHWRHRDKPAESVPTQSKRSTKLASGTPNPITGRPTPGPKYAPTTRAQLRDGATDLLRVPPSMRAPARSSTRSRWTALAAGTGPTTCTVVVPESSGASALRVSPVRG